MRIWKLLILLLAINLLFHSAFAEKIKNIWISPDKNFYKIFLLFDKTLYRKPLLFSDIKRHFLVLSIPNDIKTGFYKDYYSVAIIGENNSVVILCKNPKFFLKKTKVYLYRKLIEIKIPYKSGKKRKYVIVIDPGHGGKDPGAIYYGVKEKDINLAIAKDLYSLLAKNPRFKVYLTRKGDYFVSLKDRQIFTSKVRADLFISIHTNADPEAPYRRGSSFYILSYRGAESKLKALLKNPKERKLFINLYPTPGKRLTISTLKALFLYTRLEGKTFAEILRHYWCKTLDKTIPCGKIYKRSFAVLKVPGVPTVLVEIGFMTNKKELHRLTSKYFQRKIAKVIYKAILDYF